jgi:hypothetical protein
VTYAGEWDWIEVAGKWELTRIRRSRRRQWHRVEQDSEQPGGSARGKRDGAVEDGGAHFIGTSRC